MTEQARLWLLTSNDRKLIQRVCHSAGLTASELNLPVEGHFGAAVFAAGGEVLSVRRPLPADTRVDSLIDNKLRSYRLLATWEGADGRPFRSERTQPFRHKGWVFAICGDVPPADQPCADEREQRFVERYVRGDTSRERLMGRILARLNAADPRSLKPDAGLLKTAIEGAIEPILGDGFAAFTIALTTDDYGVVYNRGREVHYTTVRSLRSNEDEDAYKYSDPNAQPGHHLRAMIAVDGPVPDDPAWKALPSGSLLVLDEMPPATVV